MGDSVPISSSSRMGLARSVGYCRGEEDRSLRFWLREGASDESSVEVEGTLVGSAVPLVKFPETLMVAVTWGAWSKVEEG